MKHVGPNDFLGAQLPLPFSIDPQWIANAPKGFWQKADIQGEDDYWLWQMPKNSGGYGAFGNGLMAHLVSFRAAHGEMPEGRECGHKCHTNACINPRHLEPVTRKQNAAEAGLRRRGKPFKVLSEAIVITARQLRRAGWKIRDIAEKFKVLAKTLSLAIRGRTWAWITEEPAVC